jgi:hypothetical protein
MQTIETHYIGPTNTKPGCVKLGWSEMYLAGSTQHGFVFAFPPTAGDLWIGR